MDSSEKVLVGILLGGFALFGSLIFVLVYESHRIATAPDPITTACALGKEKACIALANRKP